jgi:5-keto 4-deoxyuronate isomerase
MTLTKITPALENRELADNNIHAEFAGNVTISGLYEYIDNDEGMFIGKGEVCFTVKESDSVQKLPIAKFATTVKENTDIFFCFSNNEKAQELLGKTKGEVTITISSYTDDTFEGEALNRAVLESVKK